MKIEDLLVKPLWHRRLPSNSVDNITSSSMVDEPMNCGSGKWLSLNQDDFWDELTPSSHQINSLSYKTLRPKYEWDAVKKKVKIVGYEDVERVSWGLEEIAMRILSTHAMGNNIKFRNEGDETMSDELKLHKSHWNMTGMHDALLQWFHDAGAIGDSALYLYRKNGKVEYRVFSYLRGDLISKPNKSTFVRKYYVNNEAIVEVYDLKNVSVWIKDSDKVETLNKSRRILEKLGIGYNKVYERSDDGWKCIERIPHGGNGLPVEYLRFDDVFYGAGVSLRERLERTMSYWGDSNNAFGTPIMTLNGKVTSLPPMGIAGKVFGFNSPDGKAALLTPPDASTSITLDVEKNYTMYKNVLSLVIFDPKDIKGGDPSGSFLSNLYFPAIQWSMLKISLIRHNINNVITIFDDYVGKIEKKSIDFEKMKMSWTLEPFYPRNKMEEMTLITMPVNTGVTSIETATEEIDHNSPFEVNRLREQDKYESQLDNSKKEKRENNIVDNVDNQNKNKNK
ncbi:MAG: hypothetical protein RR513_06525 [Muribaculaceae bacterium]